MDHGCRGLGGQRDVTAPGRRRADENLTWGGGGPLEPPQIWGGGVADGAPRGTSLFPQCKYLKVLAPTCFWGGGGGGRRDVLERLTTVGGAPAPPSPLG